MLLKSVVGPRCANGSLSSFGSQSFGTNNFECFFGSQFFVTCCQEVINLSDHAPDHLTFVCAVTHSLVMSSGLEVERLQHEHSIAVFFPQLT